MDQLLILVIAFVATFFGGLGALYLKKGSARFRFTINGLLLNTGFLAGVLFYVLSVVIMLYAYRFAELSYVYPLVSLSYVWVAVFSSIFLKEKLNKYKWLGILLIVLGIALINIRG